MNKIYCLLAGILFAPALWSQQRPAEFSFKVNYLVYLPKGYAQDTAVRWPMVVFLHGSGERGADLSKVKVNGLPQLIDSGRQFPFIVVSPQAPAGEGWEPELMYRFIKGLKQSYRVDEDRLYLTGLSMGGFGTWAIAAKYPYLFAAIAPICGGGDTADAWKMRNLPIWCFHGAKDNVVSPEESIRMVDAVKKLNPDTRLTIYPEANHDSWTAAYNTDSLYSWLLSKKRFHFVRKTLSEQELRKYEGEYRGGGQPPFHLVVQEGRLLLKEQPGLEIIPAGGGKFFIDEGNGVEVEVSAVTGAGGKVEKLVAYGNRMVEYIKEK